MPFLTASKDIICDGCSEIIEKDEEFLELDGEKYCEGCAEDGEYYGDFYDEDLIDGVGFADPGGNSSLRAETESNPRNLPCPECHDENVLTQLDVARGYRCDRCADRAEQGWD